MTKTEVKELLIKLGATKEEVVKTLIAEECRGFRFSAHTCPVANYLKKHGCYFVSVCALTTSPGWVFVESPGLYAYQLTLPDPVNGFALDFDNGKYPDLVTPTKVL